MWRGFTNSELTDRRATDNYTLPRLANVPTNASRSPSVPALPVWPAALTRSYARQAHRFGRPFFERVDLLLLRSNLVILALGLRRERFDLLRLLLHLVEQTRCALPSSRRREKSWVAKSKNSVTIISPHRPKRHMQVNGQLRTKYFRLQWARPSHAQRADLLATD